MIFKNITASAILKYCSIVFVFNKPLPGFYEKKEAQNFLFCIYLRATTLVPYFSRII